MEIHTIRSYHISEFLGEVEVSENMKYKIRSLLNQLFDYAIQYDYTDKNYARLVTMPKGGEAAARANLNHHISYTDDELNTLWQNINDPYVAMIVIQCYTGWRPAELLDLRIENISLTDWTMMGGMKTDAGKDRLVPIHEKIRDLVVSAYDSNRTYLFEVKGKKIPYTTFLDKYNTMLKRLGLPDEHRPHDGRKTFITLAKKYNLDEYAIKRIVGHAIDDITEKIYTDRPLDWYHSEISKIL